MDEIKEIKISEAFAALPPEYPLDLSSRIRAERRKRNSTIVVLDDDPTGTQTVHDVPVLTEWNVKSISEEFGAKSDIFYILTNSRSMGSNEATELAAEIARNLNKASDKTGRDFMVISRGDSTLRGHYPGEVKSLHNNLKTTHTNTILIPAFFEGGRYTINDVHYVRDQEILVPVSMTSFAKDKAFGFSQSDLKLYIEEKTKGEIKSSEVVSFSLQELRTTSPEAIADKLRKTEQGTTFIVNAVTYRDLEVFVLGLYLSGAAALLRTAASIVPVIANIKKQPLLSSKDFQFDKKAGIVIIVGSYVPKTSRQLEHLNMMENLHHIEVDVSRLLEESEGMLKELILEMNNRIAQGKDVVLYTSRKLITSDDPLTSLQIGNKVSDFMTSLVQGMVHQPKCIIAKGGITSSDTATKGLNVKKALVIGQVAPGIPVWKLGEESKFPGLNYVVFPGNVGEDTTLKDVIMTIRG